MARTYVSFMPRDEQDARHEALRLYRAWMEAHEVWCSAVAETLRSDYSAAEEAWNAYSDCGIDLDTDYSDEPILCAKSGLPMVEGDEWVMDTELPHLRYLRAACGLPPRALEPKSPDLEPEDERDLLPTIAEVFDR